MEAINPINKLEVSTSPSKFQTRVVPVSPRSLLAIAPNPSDANPIRENNLDPQCTGGRNRTHNPRFWKPVLCQLSYARKSLRFKKYGL